MRTVDIPDGPLVITFLITPMMESNFRKSLIISKGSIIEGLFPSNLAIVLAIAAIILTFLAVKYSPSRQVKKSVLEAKDISDESLTGE